MQSIGVIGLGYVGGAVASGFSEVADVRFHDPARKGSVALDALAAWADVLFVCVPTPEGRHGAADLGAVEQVVADLAGCDVPVVLKSTVPPRTSERLAARVPLVFSPEFLRERCHVEDFARPARIVLGWTPSLDAPGRDLVRRLHARRFPDVPVVELSSTEAEVLKYATNAFFGVKVSFANELSELCGRLGADWERVRRAMTLDPRIGDDHLGVPGPDGRVGFGGSCLPKDMAALLRHAAELEARLAVVEAALEANRARRPDETSPVTSG